MAVAAYTRNDPRLTCDESHVYRLGDRVLISVTQAIAAVGMANFSSPWFTEAVKERGTAVHRAIALDVEGDLDESTVAEDVRGGLEGWRKFVREKRPEIEFSEQMLCDPVAGIAGQLDYIAVIHDGPRPEYWLIDVKRALYPSAAIQTAAYADMATDLYDRPVYFKRAALVLPGDGTYLFHPFSDAIDRARWQAVALIVAWRHQHDCF